MNVLFVCLANQQRSPTAEDMLRKFSEEDVKTRSAGILESANKRVDEDFIKWSDRIYVMTERIKNRIEQEFSGDLGGKQIKVLGIPDKYRRDDPRLKRRLRKEFNEDDVLSKYMGEEIGKTVE